MAGWTAWCRDAILGGTAQRFYALGPGRGRQPTEDDNYRDA
jgi:hypothetical protein